MYTSKPAEAPKKDMLTTSVSSTKESNTSSEPLVFQLWPTGETFNKYQDYVEAMFNHKQPVWTCRFTGRTGLLYAEAWESEKKAEAQILALPEDLRTKLVRRVHGSTESIEQLAQALVDMAVTGPGVGDCVKVTVEGEPMRGRIIEVLTGQGPSQYRVELLGPATDTEPSPDLAGEVGATGTGVLRVLESKSLISRNLAKKLIRGCATRKHQFSPWVVDDNLCRKYRLLPAPPSTGSTKSIASQVFGGNEPGAPPEAPALPEHLTLEYPVPDLLVPYQLIQSCQWPSPQWSRHSSLHTLEAWNFLHQFGEGPLELAPFDLEDWERALGKHPPSWVIWEEAVIALLKPLITHRRATSKTAFANLMKGVEGDFPGLVMEGSKGHGEEQARRLKDEQTESLSESEDGNFAPSSDTFSPSSSEEESRRVRGVRRKAPIQTRKSIRTLAKSLPDVVLRPKKQAPPPFDFRTLKWHDSFAAAQLLHETQRRTRADSVVANSLLLGMFVELETQFDWIEAFLGGKL